jgi:hypothetical protein
MEDRRIPPASLGLWVTNSTVAGTHELTGIAGASSNGVARHPRVVPPIDNFNGNNTSDILFRNATSGDTWFEAISNGAFGSWTQIGSSNTFYGVAGTGDFYGTGTTDILYRGNSTGDTWIEAISNGAFAGWPGRRLQYVRCRAHHGGAARFDLGELGPLLRLPRT